MEKAFITNDDNESANRKKALEEMQIEELRLRIDSTKAQREATDAQLAIAKSMRKASWTIGAMAIIQAAIALINLFWLQSQR